MCASCYTVKSSRHHCCNAKTTISYLCIVELHVIVNNTEIFYFSQHCFYVAGNSKKYLGLLVKCPTMSNFNQILTSSTYCPNIKLHGNPSRGSRDDPRGQTDGRSRGLDRADTSFSQLCHRS
jgi:hypothetical protein